jgi:3-hydroxyisobutyrate dehydrogenase
MLASGDAAAIELCRPFFSAVSARVLSLGPAGAGSRLKMVTNGWIMSAVCAIAEAMALAEALGVDGRRFLEALDGMPMDMGYAQIKGEMIANRSYPVQLSLANGLKDVSLSLEAARAQGLPARVTGAAVDLMEAATAAGWGAEDIAAAFNAAVPAHPNTPNPGGNER